MARWRALLSAAILAAPFLSAASAQDLHQWLNEDYLTGDWGGVRQKLAQNGVKITFQYFTNLAGNPVGGRAQGFTYTDSLNLAVNFDLEKLVAWKGGGFHVTFTNRDGSSLTKDYIGNLFTVQQIYGPTETYRLTEMTVEQSLDGGAWDLRPGGTRPTSSRRRRSTASS
jgi:porin